MTETVKGSKMKDLFRASLVFFIAVVPAWAQSGPPADTAVDLELVLAVDASRSIDGFEYDLQRKGYIAALTSPRVLRAIGSGPLGRIAVAYVEWSGTMEQATLVKWAVIGDPATASRFAEALKDAPRYFYDGTSISGAIDYSARLFAENGIQGTRRVIDISADGVNNRGRPAAMARDDAVAAGIAINGLAIINDRPSRPAGIEPALDSFFIEHVIGGPGAFVMVVEGFESFGSVITRKLIREIAGVDGGPGVGRLARLP